jgi:preprotein translocase subunit YajC
MPSSRKILFSSLALVLAAAAVPATAQTAAAGAQSGVSVGAKVVDTAGGEVGTVISIDGDNLLVKTDRHEVALPKTSFTPTDKGLLFGLTRAQLNAQADQALAAQGPVVSVGATVYDPQGGVVGTVQALDPQFATVKLPNSTVKLPVSAFGRGPKGPLVGETAAAIEAKANAAGAASAPAAVTPPQ